MNSVFKHNTTGMLLGNLYSNTIKQNIITENNIGIKGAGTDSIYCNKIFNDTLYDFYYNNTSSNNNYQIGANDWGTTNDSLIRTKIYDGYVNITLGLVNFLPKDTVQCYLSTCNLVLTPTVTNATCDTCHNGKITLVPSNGGAPYNYTWYTTPLKTTPTISSLLTGDYKVCVTDARGCSKCDTIFVDSINCNAFKATAHVQAASCGTCANGNAQVTLVNGNAPFNYLWNTSPASTNDSVFNQLTGNYAVCVTDYHNCQSCDTVFIDSTLCNGLQVQPHSFPVSCITCNDGTAWGTVSGGTAPFNFSWNTFPISTNDSIFNKHHGVYTVSVTDFWGCTTADSVRIDSINCIGFSVSTTTISFTCNTCSDGLAVAHLTGGTSPFNFNWNTTPSINNDSIINQPDGNYIVIVTDNVGCIVTDTVRIDSIDCTGFLATAFAKNTTCSTCPNGKAWAVVFGGSVPLTYSWNTSPVQTTDTVTNLIMGSYTVCVTDVHSCISCSTVLIDSTICFGFHSNPHQINPSCPTCNDGSAWVLPTGGALPYNYTWYTSPMQNTAAVANLSPGNYAVCITDANTCAVCDTLNLTQFCSAQFTLSPDTVAHHYLATNLTAGIAPLSYTWSWGDGSPDDTGAYPNHTYAVAGFYSICLSITDAMGCQSSYCDSFYLMKGNPKSTMIYITVIHAAEQPNGIEQLKVESEKLQVYPNPVGNQLSVIGYQLLGNTIQVYDVLGRLQNQQINKSTNQQITINVSSLSTGVYFLKLTDAKGNIRTAKFVKQ